MDAQVDISLKWFVIVNPVAGSGRGLDDLPQITLSLIHISEPTRRP